MVFLHVLKFSAIFFIVCLRIYCQGTITYSQYCDTIEQNDISHKQIKSLFQFIAENEHVLDYSDCNICKSRAHIITSILENKFKDIKTGKAWLFAFPKLSSKREQYQTKPIIWLRHKNICSEWGYHVTPIIITPSDTFVIDPATQKKAVKLGKWAASLVPYSGEALLVIKQSKYYIFPDDEYNLFEDEKTIWGDENENLYDEHCSRSIDEIVRAKMGLIEPWKMNELVKKIKKLIEE